MLYVFAPRERFNGTATFHVGGARTVRRSDEPGLFHRQAIHVSLPKRKPRLSKSGVFKADRGWKVGTTQIRAMRRQAIGSSPSQVFQPRLATPTNPRKAEILMSASIHCMPQNAIGGRLVPGLLGTRLVTCGNS
jgi:hypothetical protein